MSGARDKGGELAKLSEVQLARLIDDLRKGPREDAKELLKELLNVRTRFTPELMWEDSPGPLSYWILVLNGTAQPSDVALARDLAYWHCLSARNSARVTCVLPNERPAYHGCFTAFKFKSCPALIISDTPDMSDYILLESRFLLRVSERPGLFEGFLSQVQNAFLENGSLEDIRSVLDKETFYQALGAGADFLKELIKLRG
jgi:hypothetical protein